MPEFESLTQALIACVKACGGSKVVGHTLWPEKPIDAAQRHLLACLNEDKPERLTPDHLVLLIRMGHARGCHDVMRYIADVSGYAPPVPVDPKDEVAELLRQSIEQTRQLERTNARLAGMLTPQQLRSVA